MKHRWHESFRHVVREEARTENSSTVRSTQAVNSRASIDTSLKKILSST